MGSAHSQELTSGPIHNDTMKKEAIRMTPLDIIIITIFSAIMLAYAISIVALAIHIIRIRRNPVPLMHHDAELDFDDLDVEYLHPMSDIL